MTHGYERDAQVLTEIGRCLTRAALPKIEVRLPRHLAQQAVAAWERDEPGPDETQRSDDQHAPRRNAAALALVGLAVTQDGRWDGDEAVVELDPAFVGMAIAAADDQPPAPDEAGLNEPANASGPAQTTDATDANSPAGEHPELLGLDEAYRAAFYMVLSYARRAAQAGSDTELLVQYMWSDPARWTDWQAAVRRALADVDGLANPDHEGIWRVRPDWPA